MILKRLSGVLCSLEQIPEGYWRISQVSGLPLVSVTRGWQEGCQIAREILRLRRKGLVASWGGRGINVYES